MSRFANDALLGGGVRVRVGIREQRKKIKGTTKPLMAILDISQRAMKSKVRMIKSLSP